MQTMHTNRYPHRFFIASFVLVMGGCSSGSDQTSATRRGVQLNNTAPQTGRSSGLQHLVTAMDTAAFDSQRSGLRLKLSYELTLSPRKI